MKTIWFPIKAILKWNCLWTPENQTIPCQLGFLLELNLVNLETITDLLSESEKENNIVIFHARWSVKMIHPCVVSTAGTFTAIPLYFSSQMGNS